MSESIPPDMFAEIKQAISKENFQGEELSHLEADFYQKALEYKQKLDPKDKEQFESLLKSLVRKRLGKIIPAACSLDMTKYFAERLSEEEKELFLVINKTSQEFIAKIFPKDG